MKTVRILAPCRGWAAPLDEVPDPVFAERMMGEGIAIDPLEGVMLSPAAGRVAAAPATGHAITLELENGAHLLLHVGIDTVALAGEGFSLCVAEGQQVAAGDPLIRFDLDGVGRRAKSLLSPLLVIDPGYRVTLGEVGRLVEAGAPLMTIAPAAAASRGRPAEAGADTLRQRRVVVALANGLHARPAARLVNALKGLDANASLVRDTRSADARSMVALLALGARQGDELLISASGSQAERALAAITALLEEEAADEAPVRPAPNRSAVSLPGRVTGIAASPGLAAGPIVQFRPPPLLVPRDGADVQAERAALAAALEAAASALAAAPDAGGIGMAHLAIVGDPALRDAADAAIRAGRSAGHAWRSASRAAAESIRATGDPLLIERIADLDDVERRLLTLLGAATEDEPDVPPGAILVAQDLLPSQFLAIAPRVGGILTAAGGATAHVAILALSAGLPMIVAAGAEALDLPEGRMAILDADQGALELDPTPAALAEAGHRVAAREAARRAARLQASEPGRTADGARIEIFANLGSAADAAAAVALGAEGCGLLRTEFLFLDRAAPPCEEEQAEAYAEIAAALAGRPLIIRTLDAGADKQLPYLRLPREDNPALGRRGIRLGLSDPPLLRTQLRAIVRAVPAEQCRIMLPMVVERSEVLAVRAMLSQEMEQLGRPAAIPLGVMIETPAAALLADDLARDCDFFSVGSNDLSQYALASDRCNPAVAERLDPLHPAVLRLIAAAARGAAVHGRWIGLCGGLASDPAAAAILIGLGLSELSAAPAVIPELKARVRSLRHSDCAALAERALACGSAAEVRALLDAAPDRLKGAA